MDKKFLILEELIIDVDEIKYISIYKHDGYKTKITLKDKSYINVYDPFDNVKKLLTGFASVESKALKTESQERDDD